MAFDSQSFEPPPMDDDDDDGGFGDFGSAPAVPVTDSFYKPAPASMLVSNTIPQSEIGFGAVFDGSKGIHLGRYFKRNNTTRFGQ